MSRYAGRKALLARMRATIAACAERTAVRTHKTRVSYREFSRFIGRLCRELRNPKRVPRGPVGLLLDRSATAYAAMWATISHGRPYIPLNPQYPAPRLRSIVRQARIDVVICTRTDRDLACLLGITPDNIVVAETAISPGGGGGRIDRLERVRRGRRNRLYPLYVRFDRGAEGRTDLLRESRRIHRQSGSAHRLQTRRRLLTGLRAFLRF